jgi:hypothetical protein
MKRLWTIEFNKLFFLIGILLIIAACVPSKKDNGNNYFEGEIIYKNVYIAKTSQADTAAIITKLGRTSDYFFKEGNHFETYNGSILAYEIYNRKANKLFVDQNQKDTMHWVDCSDEAGGKMLKFELHPKVEKVLGIDCDELVTYYENRTFFEYFNSDELKINPDWLSKFKLYDKGWNFQKMGALPLKRRTEYKTFTHIITAIAIKERSLNDSLFEVPKNKIMVKDKW